MSRPSILANETGPAYRLFFTIVTASEHYGIPRAVLERAIHACALPAKRTSRTRYGRPSGPHLLSREAIEAWIECTSDA